MINTLREYLALALAAVPAINREDFKQVYRVTTADLYVKNARHDANKAQGMARRNLLAAWGDLWAKSGWDVANVVTTGKEYLLASWRTRTFPVRVFRAGAKAMLGRHAQIRKGERGAPYCPRITIK